MPVNGVGVLSLANPDTVMPVARGLRFMAQDLLSSMNPFPAPRMDASFKQGAIHCLHVAVSLTPCRTSAPCQLLELSALCWRATAYLSHLESLLHFAQSGWLQIQSTFENLPRGILVPHGLLSAFVAAGTAHILVLYPTQYHLDPNCMLLFGLQYLEAQQHLNANSMLLFVLQLGDKAEEANLEAEAEMRRKMEAEVKQAASSAAGA